MAMCMQWMGKPDVACARKTRRGRSMARDASR
jgi:hypothetical protein